MSWRDGRVAGLPARVARVSFTGESSFENQRPGGLRALAVDGADAQRPALRDHALRHRGDARAAAERGFIIAGQDTDGTVTPIDLGMEWIVSRSKDFIGKRSLDRADTMREDRKQLVGLLTENPRGCAARGRPDRGAPSPRCRCA